MAGEQLSSDDEVPDEALTRGSVSEQCVSQPGGPSAGGRDHSIL